ncbi:MAG: Biopolymer transport protein ExbB [Chlamydiae bacterium]|nr:Biopolymer transport protein ExbB [Chlamydiota bacterium]
MNLFLLTNPLLEAYSGADPFGKGIFLSLLLLSIGTWIVFLQKFLSQKHARAKGRQLITTFEKKRHHPLGLETSTLNHPYASLYNTLKSHAQELLQKNRSVLQERVPATLSSSDVEQLDTYLQSTLSTEIQSMEKNLFVLSTIVSLAPFLGLLGTVWGILLTFQELQAGTGAIQSNTAMLGGLAMALGTTVFGLLVAIPALVGYNYLKASTSQFAKEMEDFSQIMLANVELQYRQIELK